MKVHLIHGIYTEPTSPVRGLIPFLEDAGFTVCYPDYGFETALETRIVNPMIVGALLPYIAPDDILICHSNGCAISYELMKQKPIQGAVFINGALETTLVRPATCGWIDVYFNAGDDVTIAARIGADLGLSDLQWGELGHSGYSGNDPLVCDIDCGKTSGMPVVSGHSDLFTPAKLAAWGPYLVDRIKRKLTG